MLKNDYNKNRPRIECPNCGKLITKANFTKHYQACVNPNSKYNLKKNVDIYKVDHEDLVCKFCNKELLNKNALVQHELRCKENPNRKDFNRLGNYSHINFRGQTKFTNNVIAKASGTLQEGYDSGRIIPYAKGKPGTFTGKHHSEETKRRLSEIGKYNASNHINGWKAGNSRKQNKYEKFASQFLTKNKIPFKEEVKFSLHQKGEKGFATYYQLDFLIADKINLELDGSGHNFSNDIKRDSIINSHYEIYRIKHKDSIEELEKELYKFIDYIKDKIS